MTSRIILFLAFLPGISLADNPVPEAPEEPAPTAKIIGPDPCKETNEHPGLFYEEVPTVTFELTGLNPYSTTFLRTYRGPPTPDPKEGSISKASIVIVPDAKSPQDHKLVLDDLDRLFVQHGIHTVEIVHQTPARLLFLNPGSGGQALAKPVGLPGIGPD